MRGFCSKLTANDAFISFVFITGAAKFPRNIISSAFNSFIDVSLEHKYAGIMGFARKELIAYFPDYIAEAAARLDTDKNAALGKI